MPASTTEPYAHVEWVSREYGGVPVPNLIEIFELEKDFHERILVTESQEQRRQQYHDLYERVHQLKQSGAIEVADRAKYERLVLTFRRELQGKSVLEVGCGGGTFLISLARLLPHGELWGLDTSEIEITNDERPFKFLKQDITSFTAPRQFDVVFSHQVFEHIAPADTPSHLRAIHKALVPGGKFIVCLPNKYWGPQDITRIVDNTFRGKVPALGSHLNESSYSELIPQFASFGFHKVRTILPLAAFIPLLRSVRVKPFMNSLLERSEPLRKLCNLAASGGRPIFKNPIMLVCERS
jgi:2-polyprenyl-3-methyl-5-hydroxy-6-metoxy-1,4-benzoquinol methylase